MAGYGRWSRAQARKRKVTGERSDHPEPLGQVLEGLRGDRRLAAGMSLGELGRRWGDVVGERLAMETRPAGVEGGVLLVRASSAAWAAQVRFLATEVRARANQALGKEAIREVRVVLDGG
jgi:predicted nucleic acid-binding Zn ribbon protein